MAAGDGPASAPAVGAQAGPAGADPGGLAIDVVAVAAIAGPPTTDVAVVAADDLPANMLRHKRHKRGKGVACDADMAQAVGQGTTGTTAVGDSTVALEAPADVPGDARLALVVAHWPTLPEAVRQAVAHLVSEAAGERAFDASTQPQSSRE